MTASPGTSKVSSRRKVLAAIAVLGVCGGGVAAGILSTSNSSKGDSTPPPSGLTPPTNDPTGGVNSASLTAQFMSRGETSGIGGNSGRRLSEAIPRRRTNRALADATNGGSAREADVEVFKLNLKEIVLCSQVPVAEASSTGSKSSFQKMKDANTGEYGCVRVYGTTYDHDSNYWTNAVGCTGVMDVSGSERRYECADTGTAFDTYVESLPVEDWVDLADPDFMKNFAIQAAPEADSKFTWGWVQWRDAGIVQATVPLDGGGNIYSKSAARSDRNNDQQIEYFPTVISATDANMLEGPAEPMKYMIDEGARRSVFQLGVETVLESEKAYKLDLTYSLDRSVIIAVTGQDIFSSASCKRDDEKSRLFGCSISNLNVISLRDEGTGMEIKTPTLLPILHASDASVVKQTYMIEIDPNRPGATGNFIYKSGNPWYVRLDTLYVLSAARVNDTGTGLTAEDPMYGAVMSLLDYFEVNDYLGDAYDFGQVRRILTIDGFNDGNEILAAGAPFYSMIGYDWRRLYDIGEQANTTLYFVEGGNAAYWCRCDIDLPLVKLMKDQSDSFPGGKEDLAATCRLTLDYNTFDAYKAAVDSGESDGYLQCPFWDEKKVCSYMPQSVEQNCVDGDVKDGDWCQSCCYQNFEYEAGVRDLTNGLVMTTPTDDSDDIFVWNDDYCLQNSTSYFGGLDGPCVNGEDWNCNRQNFGTVGEGCGYSTEWKYQDPVTYELVEEAEIDFTKNEFVSTFAPTFTPTLAPTFSPTLPPTSAPSSSPVA